MDVYIYIHIYIYIYIYICIYIYIYMYNIPMSEPYFHLASIPTFQEMMYRK